MTEDEIEHICYRASRIAVHETLKSLGIDVDEPIESQKDFAHLRAWRESVANMKRQSLIVGVGVFVSGALGLLWMFFKDVFNIKQ